MSQSPAMSQWFEQLKMLDIHQVAEKMGLERDGSHGNYRSPNREDYEALAARMRTMQGRLLLSINDHPDIRALFVGFRTIELELAYSISREKTGKASRELAICNW